jgi:hypothetical protein
MVTLVEFLYPLQKAPMREICLAVMYYCQHYEQVESLTVEDIRKKFVQAHVKNSQRTNVAAVLSQLAPYVHTVGKDGPRYLWSLTPTGEDYIQERLNLPKAAVEIEYDVTTLEQIAQKIKDPDIKQYIEESLKCLRVGALRAAVVFLWAGAVRTIQEKVISCDNAKVNAALLKHDPKSRPVTSVDDFAYVKEKNLLLCAQEVSIFDKNQRSILEDALELRNKCGHPGKYSPGQKKVSSFIEDLMTVVFV